MADLRNEVAVYSFRLVATAVVCFFLLVAAAVQCAPQMPPFILLKFANAGKNLFVEYASDPKKFEFDKDLDKVYNIDRHEFAVRGKGQIRYESNVITVEANRIAVNGRSLDGPSLNYILAKDGSIRPGFIRTFR